MAANTSPIFPLTPKNGFATFVNSDGTTKKTLYTAGSFAGLVFGILCTSTDTADVNANVYINDGSTDWYIDDIDIPAGSGTGTISRVDGIPFIAPAGLPVLPIQTTYILKVAMNTAVTSGKTVTVTVIAGDY